MDWTQLTIPVEGEVTECIIRLGFVGHDHGQWQIEARNSSRELVAMCSVHHFDPLVLGEALVRIAEEVTHLHATRHAPF